MTGKAEPAGTECKVIGAKHLLRETGGGKALCAEMRQAATAAGMADIRIDVQVLSPSRISAAATLPDGRSLGPVHVGVSDRALTTRSFKMLAEALAAQLKSGAR